MKYLFFYFSLLLPLTSLGQTISKSIKISKLIIDSKKTFNFKEGDSTASFSIDTLIMKDKSSLFFVAKKKVNLVVNYAVIGKDCVIRGNDTKNNGTDLNLSVNFIQLKSLFIDVSGGEARAYNRHYDNGNGGNVVLSYLSSGRKPQVTNKRGSDYLSIKNNGGGNIVNPQTDIAVLLGQIRTGAPGRVGGLPNGRVYSGNTGRNGKTIIQPADSLN